MSRRDKEGKYARQYSTAAIASMILGALLCLLITYLIGKFLWNDLAAFRSCSHNDTGLAIQSCGKQRLNGGDVVVIGLFLVGIAITINVFGRIGQLLRRRS